LLDALKKHKNVLQAPQPQVYFKGFGESSLDIEAFYWIDLYSVNVLDLKTEIHREILKEFNKAKIKIPYKQIEVTMRKK